MTHVQTVRGPVPVDRLGATLMGERGVTDEQLTTMLVDNPRRYFSGEIT
jgi:predicted metal-dependent phosphotriesterase family hydrolase